MALLKSCRHLGILSMLLLLLFGQGCGALPVTLTGVLPMVVSGAGGGVAYTVTNVAYKTFSYPIEMVEGGVHAALERMEIKEVDTEVVEDGVEITARTKKLRIYLTLEKITATTTKLKVNAKRGALLKDKSTATEIIEQVDKVVSAGENGGGRPAVEPGVAPGGPGVRTPYPDTRTEYNLQI